MEQTDEKLNRLLRLMADQQASLNMRLDAIEDRLAKIPEAILNGPPQEFYTASEFARKTGMSKNTVLRRCREGIIKSTQPNGAGTLVSIPASELGRFHQGAEL